MFGKKATPHSSGGPGHSGACSEADGLLDVKGLGIVSATQRDRRDVSSEAHCGHEPPRSNPPRPVRPHLTQQVAPLPPQF